MSQADDTDVQLDVLVIGAGPAGLCAALRLRQLGYRVTLVERARLPRAHIGEALTPGVRNILDLLDATDAIADVPLLAGMPTRLAWSGEEVDSLAPERVGGGVMVDRAAFDHALLHLLEERGGTCLAPAEVGTIEGAPGAWRITVRQDARSRVIGARMILDARGRSAAAGTWRMALAPPLLAVWAETDASDAPSAIHVEALADGWLWGSPLPGGGYRVMSFCDPSTMRQATRGKPEKWLRDSMGQSRLFAALAQTGFKAPVLACSATSSLDEQTWLPGHIKLGDAAFAIDPLSSSGVEKAMRFSLQAVVAVNTMLRDPGATVMARDFYMERLLDCVARHCVWTRRHYSQAWPGASHAFWHERAREFQIGGSEYSPLAEQMRQACRRAEIQEQTQDAAHAAFADPAQLRASPPIATLLNGSVMLSPLLGFVALPCVVEDRVQLREAITHPSLERPIAYLQGQEIAGLLRVVPHVASLATAVELWALRMPLRTAQQIAEWLCRKGVLQIFG